MVSRTMNRAFLIIFIPAILVVFGYILVFRAVGIVPGYLRLVIMGVIFLVLLFWLSRRKAASGAKSGK